MRARSESEALRSVLSGFSFGCLSMVCKNGKMQCKGLLFSPLFALLRSARSGLQQISNVGDLSPLPVRNGEPCYSPLALFDSVAFLSLNTGRPNWGVSKHSRYRC